LDGGRDPQRGREPAGKRPAHRIGAPRHAQGQRELERHDPARHDGEHEGRDRFDVHPAILADPDGNLALPPVVGRP